jgi:hypothetical protein
VWHRQEDPLEREHSQESSLEEEDSSGTFGEPMGRCTLGEAPVPSSEDDRPRTKSSK